MHFLFFAVINVNVNATVSPYQMFSFIGVLLSVDSSVDTSCYFLDKLIDWLTNVDFIFTCTVVEEYRILFRYACIVLIHIA